MKTRISAIVFAIIVSFSTMLKATEKLYDDQLASNAVVVLRVEYMMPSAGHGIIFDWQLVHVKNVFKNESNENVNYDFDIGHLKGKSGIPSGECTVYLEHYDYQNKVFSKKSNTPFSKWVLVGGDATNGVSHVNSHPKFK